MTDQELRIKVAELCGWKFVPENGPLEMPWRNTKVPAWDGSNWSGRANLPPDYPNDLNAMHEAARTLSKTQQHDYVALLWDVLGLEKSSHFWTEENFEQAFEFANATARQRAEAFVLCLQKESR